MRVREQIVAALDVLDAAFDDRVNNFHHPDRILAGHEKDDEG